MLEELKAHQQKMNHEFVEWVDPPNEDKKSISRRPHEINSDLSSLGELELVEQPRTPVNANSSWIELMQKSERHTRGLLLYTLSEQAQINYLPNRLYIIDMISRICAERNCSRWVFFNTINMLDIFVSRTALKLDAGFRTYAEVCIFISQKLQQQACLDYRKLPGSTNCGYLMDSKIHTSTALEAMILQTVKGLTPEHNLSSWVSVLADCWDDFATTHKQIKNDVDRHKILFTRRGYSTRL